jgi:hypothetical protein
MNPSVSAHVAERFVVRHIEMDTEKLNRPPQHNYDGRLV